MESFFDSLLPEPPQPVPEPAPQKKPLTAADIRRMMCELIETARTADSLPLETPEWTKNIAMFPIMAQWLDPEDGAQLVLEFETQIERLKLAA